MASVRGRLPGSSLDPARTALPLIRTGTQHTLGPVRISCLGQKDGKENGQFTMIERKRQPHQRTHLSQRKKEKKRSGLLLLFFCSTPFFFNGQRHQTKRKIKEKEKRSPDPGHYWPDTDSGPGSGPLWPGFWFRIRTRTRIYGSESSAALTHGLFWTFYGLFADFPDSILYLEDMLRCVCEEGRNCFRQNLG